MGRRFKTLHVYKSIVTKFDIFLSEFPGWALCLQVSLCVKRLVYTNEQGEIVKGVCSNFLCKEEPSLIETLSWSVRYVCLGFTFWYKSNGISVLNPQDHSQAASVETQETNWAMLAILSVALTMSFQVTSSLGLTWRSLDQLEKKCSCQKIQMPPSLWLVF